MAKVKSIDSIGGSGAVENGACGGYGQVAGGL